MLRRNIKHEKCRYHYFYDYFITLETGGGREMSKYHNNNDSDPREYMEMRGMCKIHQRRGGVESNPIQAPKKMCAIETYFPERRRQKIV